MSGLPTRLLACTWRCWRDRPGGLSMAGTPEGRLPPPPSGPGSPCQVEVGTLAVQQLPHQRPELSEPMLHVHLPLLQGGGRGWGGESASWPLPLPSQHTHLFPGEGREECQAAPPLQLHPLSLPVEVLVAQAAAKEQNVSWGNTRWPPGLAQSSPSCRPARDPVCSPL